MEWAIIGTGCTAIVAAITVIGFWMNFGDRITKAQSKADSACDDVDALQKAQHEANERITTLSAHFSMYREQAAEKFVTWEAIHQIEKRILEQQDKSEERLAKSLSELGKQFERIIDIRLRGHET